MARPRLSPEEAADRISAYVYGNILTLAALVVLRGHEIEDGTAVAILVGTSFSTFVAHAFAERLGAEARGLEHSSWRVVLADSRPILSSAAVPAVLMVIGSVDGASTSLCLHLAEAWVVARLAITGFVVGRLRGRAITLGSWVASAALAGAALLVVAVKVLLSH